MSGPDEETGDHLVVDWAIGEMRAPRAKPLFLAVGLFRPHIPWEVPQKWFDLHPLAGVKLPVIQADDLADAHDHGRRPWHRWVLENQQWEKLMQGYLASISYVDRQLGRLLDALDASPMKGNTIIVLWSDHGFHIGEKENWEKFALWTQATRVPLFIHAPRLSRDGQQTRQPATLTDLYPTLCEVKDRLAKALPASLAPNRGKPANSTKQLSFSYRKKLPIPLLLNPMNRIPIRAFVIVLSLAGFMTAPVGQAKELLPIPAKLVVLTFDDANKSDRTFVADVLKKHGFGATFYVTEGLGFLKNKEHYTTWQEIRELHDLGFEIGNHTQHHENVARVSHKQFTASLKHIDQRCIEHGIPQPTTFCYPGFQHSLGAVRTLEGLQFQFARRGVGPEFPDGGEGGRGPAYDPRNDHPLLIPTTGYAGPKWGFADLKWAVDQARDGKICVLNFHGVPALEHPWVSTSRADFEIYMQYLKDEKCTVIATRDLANYVDPARRPQDPYAPINRRLERPRDLAAKPVANPLGLNLNEYSLGWQLPPAGGKQTAFHVLVASDRPKLDANVGDLWDSGWRQSAQNADVLYRGTALRANAEFWWKVRVRTDIGATGAFSEASAIKIADFPRPPAPPKRSASAEGGEPNFIEGKIGKAVEFGPQAPIIRVPAYPELRPLDGTTVCAWIKTSVESKGKQTVFRIEDGNDRRFMAIGGANNIWGLWFGLGIGGQYTEISAAYAPDKLVDGQWHHVAGTFDRKLLRLYIDGEKVSEREQPGKLAPGRPTPASIGAYNGRHEPFHGGIDDMRVYTGALTEEQVGQLAAGKAEPAPEAIVGHWKLDGDLDNEADKNAAVAPDPSGHRIVFIGNTLISGMEKYDFLETPPLAPP